MISPRQLIDYLNNGSVMVQIMGKQYVRKSAIAKAKGLSTKEMLKSDRSVVSKYEHLKSLIKTHHIQHFIIGPLD